MAVARGAAVYEEGEPIPRSVERAMVSRFGDRHAKHAYSPKGSASAPRNSGCVSAEAARRLAPSVRAFTYRLDRPDQQM